VRSEHRFDPARERISDARARPVCAARHLAHPAGEVRRRERAEKLLDRLLDPVVERQRCDRQLAGAVEVRERDRLRLEVGIEDGRAADFFPVVVFRVDPEDGDRGHAELFGGALRELQRADRLQQREQRSAKDARLLPGRDRDRASIGESRRRRARFRRRAAALLLRRDDRGDLLRVAPERLRSTERVGPRVARRRVARVQGCDRIEVVRVRADEGPYPADRANVDGS